MQVRFNSPAEFEEELRKDPPKILRLTKGFTQTNHLPLQNVSVIATFVNRAGELVKLDRYVGQILGTQSEIDSKTLAGADKIIYRMEQLAAELKIEIRAGLYEETVSQTKQQKEK